MARVAATGRIIDRFDANFVASLSTGLLTSLPSFLSIACATTGRTTQTGASSFVRSLGANAKRARNVGRGVGLAVETARANKLCGNTDTWTGSATLQQWNSGTVTVTRTNGQTAPDGTSNAVQFALPDPDFGFGDFCSLKTFLAYGQGGTLSSWARGITRTDTAKPYGYISWDQDADASVAVEVTSTVWTRLSLTTPATDRQYPVLEYSRTSPTVNVRATVHVYAMQLELGANYPSSYFPVANGAENQTRAQDLLTCPSAALIAPGGFFNWDLVFAPHYASTEYAADHNLVFFDSNNRVYLRQSDNKIVVVVGGHASVSSALTFTRDDAVRVRVSHTAAVGQTLSVFVNDQQIGSTGVDGTVKTAISLPATAGILGDGATTSESADLRSFWVKT